MPAFCLNHHLPLKANLTVFFLPFSPIGWGYREFHALLPMNTNKSQKVKRFRKITNRLWIVRKKTGLPQKQVAFLLGHKNTTQLSRYERGARIPSLETALKLESAYNTPVRVLFSGLYDQFHADVQGRRKVLSERLRPEDERE